jgi:hypothetical protein
MFPGVGALALTSLALRRADDRLYFVALDNILRGLDRDGGSRKCARAASATAQRAVSRRTLIIDGRSVRAHELDWRTCSEVSLPADPAAPPRLLERRRPDMVAVTMDIVKGDGDRFIPRLGRRLAPLPNQPLVPPDVP